MCIRDSQSPEMQHYCYYRRQSRPEFRKLTASTPVYTIWDDHDFGVNDCAYGPAIDSPAWKRPVWKVFSNNWVNPGYGTEKVPGCYYDFQLGDIHFIMLDGRFYRDKQNKKKKDPLLKLGIYDMDLDNSHVKKGNEVLQGIHDWMNLENAEERLPDFGPFKLWMNF